MKTRWILASILALALVLTIIPPGGAVVSEAHTHRTIIKNIPDVRGQGAVVSPRPANAHTTPDTAMRIEQRTPVTVRFPGNTKIFLNFTMPFDGVFNLAVDRQDGNGAITFHYPGYAGYILNMGRNETRRTAQQSLRAGEHTIQLGYNGSQAVSITFEFFATPSSDINWTGTADAEPNGTPETAIPLRPNFTATGNINAATKPDNSDRDNTDLYRFTVLERAEIEVSFWADTGRRMEAWVSPLNDDNHPQSRYRLSPTTGIAEPATRRWTLEPGDYRIQIQTTIGNPRGTFAYEISYRVLSGSVAN